MKLPLITALAALLSAGLSSAQNTVNLEWDPSPPAEGATGYKIYQQVTALPPVETGWKLIGETVAPLTKFTVPSQPNGTTVYAVTAYNMFGESPRSNEVNATFLTAPARLRVVTVIVAP